MARNASGLARLASTPQPLLGFKPVLDDSLRPMSHHPIPHDRTAARGGPCAGKACIDSGLATGLIAGDSNRPAFGAGFARGLLKQFVAAH